jgi:UDP-3-O-[3-hydroxymyristoyl] N-acetylglucosamine deacetylase
MTQRQQRTIRSEAETSGIGFITGADVCIRFLPAPIDHGIVFQRVDLPGQPRVEASLANLIPRQRRTGISANGATIELVEHVLSACAGMQVDNCLIQLNAPETPGFDGSCREVVDCLIAADFEKQPASRASISIHASHSITELNGSELSVKPTTESDKSDPIAQCGLTISYALDYGVESPIQPQNYTTTISPETFANDICFARTFVLESEVQSLKAMGYGTRTTYQDLLVFGNDGVIDNSMHTPDECARHKILDCVGDFALIGCDVYGDFNGWRTGHNTNHALMKLVDEQYIQNSKEYMAA